MNFQQSFSAAILKQKYLDVEEVDIDDRRRVVAVHAADLEMENYFGKFKVSGDKTKKFVKIKEEYYDLMQRFGPAGRIFYNFGRDLERTCLINCTSMHEIEDSMEGIMDFMKGLAILLQAGAGVGMNFDPIRPRGALVRGVSGKASGPVSFMHIGNATGTTVESAGGRRGAMIVILSCRHLDIFEFITCKDVKGKLDQFNISVGIEPGFMHSVEKDADWELCWPVDAIAKGEEPRYKKTVKARDLWDAIQKHAYKHSDPGLVFLDNANRLNPLGFCEKIVTCNP